MSSMLTCVHGSGYLQLAGRRLLQNTRINGMSVVEHAPMQDNAEGRLTAARWRG